MDVTLVLTHRCNLNCGYCYAGEHHKTDMDEQMLDRGVDMLLADDNPTVQLSFFGGEPLLAFEAVKHATARAQTLAAAQGRQLNLQMTTNASAIRQEHVEFFAANNVFVTTSIDGVAEAHDLNRPKAGGGSSFGQVLGGLRQLIASGQQPDAMMVITPETAPHVYRSVSFLWTEGVRTVRANVALKSPWGQQERDELREQLVGVGIELVARRRRGENVRFEPFEKGMRRAGPPLSQPRRKRNQVVVGVGGNLYPCAPMVGEDRAQGPESAMRIGHIDEGPAALFTALKARSAGCSDGGKCACAAYLETGDRDVAGPVGLWLAAVCKEIGAACAEAIRKGPIEPPSKGRRPFLIGLAAAAGLSVGVPLMIRAGLFSAEEPVATGCDLTKTPPQIILGDVGEPAAIAPVEPQPLVPGSIGVIEPEPEPDVHVRGQMRAPEPRVDIDVDIDGDIGDPGY